jgi:hypothetical protein
MLIFNDYEAFEQIYGPNPQLVKDSYRYAAVSASHTPNLVTENDPHKANMKRKAHLDMWNNRSLKVAEPRLHALLDTLVSTLTSPKEKDSSAEDVKSWGKTVNLTELGTSFGFDIMMSMVTGESPNLMTDPEKRWMPDASKHVSWRALTVSSVVVRSQLLNLALTMLPNLGFLPTQAASVESGQTHPGAHVQKHHGSRQVVLGHDQSPS